MNLKKLNPIFACVAIFAFILTFPLSLKGENKDSLICAKIVGELIKKKELSTPDKLVTAARMLIGTPYVAGTLEKIPERLVVNLQQTDCILFVETCLALVKTAESINNEEDAKNHNVIFKKILQDLRYRNGVIDGYSSRLHYTSEWILQGEKNGYFKDVSKEIANTMVEQDFYYISTHPQAYKQLSGNNKEVEKIVKTEHALAKHNYYYIPKAKMAQYASQIKEGDIIGFNTSIGGLDITHIGIAVYNGKKLTFLHASYGYKKVIEEPLSLIEYMNKIKSNNGLRVIRPTL